MKKLLLFLALAMPMDCFGFDFEGPLRVVIGPLFTKVDNLVAKLEALSSRINEAAKSGVKTELTKQLVPQLMKFEHKIQASTKNMSAKMTKTMTDKMAGVKKDIKSEMADVMRKIKIEMIGVKKGIMIEMKTELDKMKEEIMAKMQSQVAGLVGGAQAGTAQQVLGGLGK